MADGRSCCRVRSSRWVCLGAVALLALPVAGGEPAGQAKYVFLFIGDGMGAAQRAAGELFLSGDQPRGQPVQRARLLMNSLPACGWATTHSHDNVVTDSAAAGTAIACGRKTANGVVAMNPDGNQPLPSLAELAKARGWKVGIVSSSTIDDATPAVFYAHQSTRGNKHDIALTLSESGFDFFGGGGALGAEPNIRGDLPDPVEVARARGYAVVTTRGDLLALKAGAGKVWAFQSVGPGQPSMHYEIDRPDDHASLAEFTRKAIELLDNRRGFFLMVEAGKIDWACHHNDAASTVQDVLALDRAVAEALEFQKRRPRETLIVVTADHETGGMGVGGVGNVRTIASTLARQKLSADRFDRKVAELRRDQVSLETAWPMIEQSFGLAELAESQKREIAQAYAYSLMDPNERLADPAVRLLYARYEPLTIACARAVSRLAGVGWTTLSHSSVPMPTTAGGVGAERFNGYYDNTDIFHKILAEMAGAETTTRPAATDAHAPAVLRGVGRSAADPADQPRPVHSGVLRANPRQWVRFGAGGGRAFE